MSAIEYVSYKEASKRTGLSEIELHRLRLRKVARSSIVGSVNPMPVICIDDVQQWIEQTHFVPTPKL